MFPHLNWFDRRNWVLATLLAVMVVAALLGAYWAVVSEGRNYAAWSNAEAFHEPSYKDGFAVGAAAVGAMLGLFLVFQVAAERFIERGLPLAEEIKEEGSRMEVAGVIAIDPGEVRAMLAQNPHLLEAETARKVLLLHGKEGAPGVSVMESMVGFEAVRRPGKAYLIRLQWRGIS